MVHAVACPTKWMFSAWAIITGHQVPYKNDSMGIMSIPFGAPGWGTGFIMVNAHYCLETTNCTLGGYHVDGKKRIQILSF